LFAPWRSGPIQQVNKFVCISAQTPLQPFSPASTSDLYVACKNFFGQVLAEQHTASVDEKTGFHQSCVRRYKMRIRYAIPIHKNKVISRGRSGRTIARARRSEPCVGMPHMGHRALEKWQHSFESINLFWGRTIVGDDDLMALVTLSCQTRQNLKESVRPVVGQNDKGYFQWLAPLSFFRRSRCISQSFAYL